MMTTDESQKQDDAPPSSNKQEETSVSGGVTSETHEESGTDEAEAPKPVPGRRKVRPWKLQSLGLRIMLASARKHQPSKTDEDHCKEYFSLSGRPVRLSRLLVFWLLWDLVIEKHAYTL